MPKQLIKLSIITLMLCSACRPQQDVSKPGYIIGPTNDIERLNNIDIATIEIPASVLENAKRASVLAVTVMRDNKQRFCSGSLIAGRNAGDLPRIITNHHCFAKKVKNTNRSLPEIVPEACEKTSVYFDFSIAEEPVARKCKSGSLVTNYFADFAIFTIDEELPPEYKPFAVWEGEVPANRKAFIIHHPSAKESKQGRESEQILKETGTYFPKKAITVNNCQVLGRFEEDFWHLNPNLPFGLRHTCDLVHGSSGSGLIDVETGQLLGINWGGITLTINKVERKDNVASSAKYLQEFVSTHNVTSPPIPFKKRDAISCGQVAGHNALPHQLFLLLLFIPPVVAGWRRLLLH